MYVRCTGEKGEIREVDDSSGSTMVDKGNTTEKITEEEPATLPVRDGASTIAAAATTATPDEESC